MKVRSPYSIGFSHGFYTCALSVILGGIIGFYLLTNFHSKENIVLSVTPDSEIGSDSLVVRVPVLYVVAELEKACLMATELSCSKVMYAYEYENALISLMLGENVVIGFKPRFQDLVYEVHLSPPVENGTNFRI